MTNLPVENIPSGDLTYALGINSSNLVRKQLPQGTITQNNLRPGIDYSLPAGFGPGTAAAINSAIAACAAAGGGTVWLPATDITLDATIDNKYARVMVNGAGGRASYHDGGTPTYGTRIIPTFAGTVLKHRTPFTSENGGVRPARNDGGGFINITVNGDSIATRLLEVVSVTYGSYDLFLTNCVGTEAALFTCGVSGVDLAEAADIQQMEICNLSIRQNWTGAVGECGGVVFSGSTNANVSHNFNVNISCQHKNGAAFRGISCDNNQINLIGHRIGGGTGYLAYLHGPTTDHPVGASGNYFMFLSGAGATYAEGTDTVGVLRGMRNSVIQLDQGNATPVPTAGTGTYWQSASVNLYNRGGAFLAPVVMANGEGPATSMLAATGTETLNIVNGAGNNLRLWDGTLANGMGINISSGGLRISRIVGSGPVQLPVGDIPNYADDAAAAAGGLPLWGLYRTGSILKVRIA